MVQPHVIAYSILSNHFTDVGLSGNLYYFSNDAKKGVSVKKLGATKNDEEFLNLLKSGFVGFYDKKKNVFKASTLELVEQMKKASSVSVKDDDDDDDDEPGMVLLQGQFTVELQTQEEMLYIANFVNEFVALFFEKQRKEKEDKEDKKNTQSSQPRENIHPRKIDETNDEEKVIGCCVLEENTEWLTKSEELIKKWIAEINELIKSIMKEDEKKKEEKYIDLRLRVIQLDIKQFQMVAGDKAEENVKLAVLVNGVSRNIPWNHQKTSHLFLTANHE